MPSRDEQIQKALDELTPEQRQSFADICNPGSHLKAAVQSVFDKQREEELAPYHRAQADMVARRLERFSFRDLQIMAEYLHANFEPTLDGLAEHKRKHEEKFDENGRMRYG